MNYELIYQDRDGGGLACTVLSKRDGGVVFVQIFPKLVTLLSFVVLRG